MIECLNGCGPMQETRYEDAYIDVCSECRSVWLDGPELAEVVNVRKREWPAKVIEKVLEITGGMGIPDRERQRVLSCPKCSVALAPVNYQGNSGIIVNTCENHHGVWLDRGELAKIQIYMEHWRKVGKGES